MEYIKEDVEKMLKEHKDNESKLTELELKREEYEERLQYAGTVYEDSKEDVIEGMQLSGQAMSDIPRSNTNKISNITYNTVVNYNREITHINKEDRVYLESKIEKCKKEIDRLNKVIVRVKNMINPLSKEEKFVIEAFYMDKAKWDYISDEYYEEFRKPKSIKQLQTYRDTAVERMLNILNPDILKTS